MIRIYLRRIYVRMSVLSIVNYNKNEGIKIALRFGLHLFCLFWYNFEEQMMEFHKYFAQFLLKRH